MKCNHTFSALLFVSAVLMIFVSNCKKEDDSKEGDNNPTNPYNGKSTAVFNPAVIYGSMSDIDGNIYKTVTIGTQTWMAENLRTTKYNDGTNILNVKDDSEWAALESGAYCNYNNTENADTIATYGRLYNFYAVSTGKLAPKGWHVPSDAEWTELTDYLGGAGVAGDNLKETGTTHWTSPNTGATNETGFTALPGAYRLPTGTFYDIGYSGYWWSVTEYDATHAWHRLMDYYFSDVLWDYGGGKEVGFSVRCVRD